MTDHRDKLGKKISLGDYAVTAVSDRLCLCFVAKLDEKIIAVESVEDSNRHFRHPVDILTLDEDEVVLFLLSD